MGIAVFAGAEQPTSLAGLFEARYQQVLKQVEAGKLPPNTKDEAKAVWFALRKDLIALDAEVQTLKLEVMSRQGALQEAALDQLGQKMAARERRLVRAIQELNQLADPDISVTPLAPSAPAANTPDQPPVHGDEAEKSPEKRVEESNTQTWDIEIEFAPEDLTKGDME